MSSRLYLHIPFCRAKCGYCAFVSQESTSGQEISNYVELLLEEMRLAAIGAVHDSPLDSVYFGGGTPSLLEPEQIAALLEQTGQLFNLAEKVEVTLEANPGTMNLERMAGFRSAGVNRLSIGVQSFSDSTLATLGRIHTSKEAVTAMAAARSTGFDNISIDLIHSLPGQTLAMWSKELESALDLRPEHISLYGLTIEEGTPFASRYATGSSLLPDDELSATMYENADNILTRNGYEHYEIANFARPGFRSRHNCGYWKRDSYLGLGVAAHSFLINAGYGTRFSNTPDLAEYEASIRQGILPKRDIEVLAREDAMAEYIFLGLRMSDGIDFRAFEQEFGVSCRDIYPAAFERLAQSGLLLSDSNTARLTLRGMLLSNQVFNLFLP